MNKCAKDTMKDMMIGGSVGSVIGAACGAASGYAGLSQLCSAPGLAGSASCDYLVSNASTKAIQIGCAVGASVGLCALSFAYTAYKAAYRACVEKNRDEGLENQNLELGGLRAG